MIDEVIPKLLRPVDDEDAENVPAASRHRSFEGEGFTMATATVGRSDIENVVRRVLNEERAEKDRSTMRAIQRVSSLLTEQIIPNLPDNGEAAEETGSQDEHEEDHDSNAGSNVSASTSSPHSDDDVEDEGNSSDNVRTAEVPEQVMEAFGALYRSSFPEQAEALAAFFTAVGGELRQRDDGQEDEDGDAGAVRKGQLAAQLRVAPAAGKPLSGVRVPGVNLQRGAQGAAVRQLQSALVKAAVMTQAQMNTGPGVFGPLTQASLKKFQRAHGVEAIGVYGPKTRAAFVRLGAKVSPKPPATGHKNPFLAQFERALVHLRLPKSWASSQALWQLVQHESSWNPRAKNPSSTAFGLFQFLKSTWATYCHEGPYGSVDPYIQALGGFRYVKARYGTPEGAWAFWQSHHWW
jgi:hypothetical protein